jgi:hypothetical protein
MALKNKFSHYMGLILGSLLLHISLLQAQSVVSGTVINSEDGTPVEGAAVASNYLKTGVLTDYRGRYTLKLAEEDTLIFSFLGYKEQRIAIHSGWNTYYTINISLEILPIPLKNFVYTEQKNSRMDSMQNRQEFQGIFNYTRPTVVSYNLPAVNYDISNSTYVFGYQGPQFSGGLGFSLNGFYSRFLSRDNDRYLHYRKVLERKEKEAYVRNYFSASTVHAITGLDGEDLKFFMKHYEPRFKTLLGKTDYDIDLLIKESYLKYKSAKQASINMPGNMK